jgi:environmental stress-induced protein Ves
VEQQLKNNFSNFNGIEVTIKILQADIMWLRSSRNDFIALLEGSHAT